jgi:tetratricopeptide (TPR) repeat protein
VLPFGVTGEADALAHVASGIGEALSAKLFHLKNVSLASGTAAERASKLGSLAKIGRELGVNLIVTGMVQRIGERIRISVNVEDLVARRRVWTQEYFGLPEDLLTLEDQIYTGLLGALGLNPASDELARAVAHPTENFEAYELYLKARNAMRGQQDPKNVEAAIQFYERALANDAGFALAYAGIADSALQMYRFTKDSTWAARALSAAEQAARLDDKLAEVHLALGNVHQATGRVAESIAELRVATQLAPNSDDGYRRLGRAYLRSGRATEAIQAHEKAVAINPYYWLNYNALGAAFLQLGSYDKAIEANLKVIELEPDNVNGHNDLGAAYLVTGRFEQAAVAFEKALKLLPNPETYTNLGIAYYYVGKFKESVPMFEKAVELSPNSEQFVGNLADGYRWAGLTEKAVSTYDRAIALALKELRINPRNAMVRGHIGLYYAKKGDTARGAQFIKNARAIDPSNVNLIYNEALVHALANRPSEALRSLKEAFEAGYPVSMAASEPDLKALSSDRRFTELLKQRSQKSN